MANRLAHNPGTRLFFVGIGTPRALHAAAVPVDRLHITVATTGLALTTTELSSVRFNVCVSCYTVLLAMSAYGDME